MTDEESRTHAACDALRKSLKENGLEHAVRIMTVPERGEARRLVRQALLLVMEQIEGRWAQVVPGGIVHVAEIPAREASPVTPDHPMNEMARHAPRVKSKNETPFG